MTMACNKRGLVLITGASHGFGQTLAWEAAKILRQQHGNDGCRGVFSDLHFVLNGRDAAALEYTAEVLLKHDVGCTVTTMPGDLSHPTSSEHVVSSILNVCGDASDYDSVILVNNAGSVGRLDQYARQQTDWKEIMQYMTLNITSCIALTTGFINRFTSHESCGRNIVVVNISSLLAIQQFPGWGLYCTGKAARDSFFSVVACEERKNNIKTLSYAPGPLNNDMQREVRQSIVDPIQKAMYQEMFDGGKLVDMKDSARVLLRLLIEDNYESGKHIDYYDIPCKPTLYK